MSQTMTEMRMTMCDGLRIIKENETISSRDSRIVSFYVFYQCSNLFEGKTPQEWYYLAKDWMIDVIDPHGIPMNVRTILNNICQSILDQKNYVETIVPKYRPFIGLCLCAWPY